MLLSGIALLIVDTMFLLTGISFMFRTVPRKSKYCILRDGLLKEHDSIIVNVKELPKYNDLKIIKTNTFENNKENINVLYK